jgi:uncharacterized membrane protein YciS (DUF1049 family)
MKFRIFVIIAIAFLLSGTTIGAENNLSVTPSVSVAQPQYNFESVVDGTQVIHDYVIQNKGATTLEIQKVKTD